MSVVITEAMVERACEASNIMARKLGLNRRATDAR